MLSQVYCEIRPSHDCFISKIEHSYTWGRTGGSGARGFGVGGLLTKNGRGVEGQMGRGGGKKSEFWAGVSKKKKRKKEKKGGGLGRKNLGGGRGVEPRG